MTTEKRPFWHRWYWLGLFHDEVYHYSTFKMGTGKYIGDEEITEEQILVVTTCKKCDMISRTYH